MGCRQLLVDQNFINQQLMATHRLQNWSLCTNSVHPLNDSPWLIKLCENIKSASPIHCIFPAIKRDHRVAEIGSCTVMVANITFDPIQSV